MPVGDTHVGIDRVELLARLRQEEQAQSSEPVNVEDLEALMQEGFDACFLAVGTCVPRSLGIPGEELPGVLKGVSLEVPPGGIIAAVSQCSMPATSRSCECRAKRRSNSS